MKSLQPFFECLIVARDHSTHPIGPELQGSVRNVVVYLSGIPEGGNHESVRLCGRLSLHCRIRARADTGAGVAPIVGVGNFSHIVANLDKSLAFYRDALGMEADGAIRPFQGDPAIMKMGKHSRRAVPLYTVKGTGSRAGSGTDRIQRYRSQNRHSHAFMIRVLRT